MKLSIFIYAIATYITIVYAFSCQDSSTCRQLMDRLDITRLQVYDKLGDVRDDIFDSWEESNVREWLAAHGIVSSKEAKFHELIESAKKHKSLLAEDIKWYTQQAKKTSMPTLEKGKEYFKQTGAELFDRAVDTWSTGRLKAYLAARGVNIQVEKSKNELVDLVKQKANELSKKDIIGSWTFDTWSTQEVKGKLEELGKNAEGTRKQLVSRLQAVMEDTQSFVQEQKAGFDTWPTDDLQAYLEDCGVPIQKIKHSRKDMIRLANQQHRLFTRGTTQTTFEQLQHHVSSLLSSFYYHTKNGLYIAYLKTRSTIASLYSRFMEKAAEKKDL